MTGQLAFQFEREQRSPFREPRARAGTVRRLELQLELSADELARVEAQRRRGDLPERPWRGGLAWALEVRRLASIMQCRTTHFERFERLCGQLTPWRLRSPAQCNAQAIEAILPILEACRHAGGVPGHLGPHSPGWTRVELGELLVEARNRKRLLELGRDRAKPKGPRFAPELLPEHRLLELIQTHPDLTIVDRLRAERVRRTTERNLAQ